MINGHGGNIKEICNTYGLNPHEITDFSASINPLGYPDCARKAILERFDDILNYPDSESTLLRKTIAEKHFCNQSNIVIGNGSNELFYLIPRALRPKRGIILQPTFSEFKDALCNANVEVIEVLNNNSSLVPDLNDTKLKGLEEGIVFLCNPNNPTGHIFQKDDILRLVKENSKRLIVVDEAFMDFVEDEEKYSVIKEAVFFDNLIVVRSLTKFYGFPGLRLGYLVSCKTIINNLSQYKEPWTVNTFAQIAGQVAINDKEFARNTKSFMTKERLYLYKGLSEIKDLYPFYPSANFVLLRIHNKGPTSSKIQHSLAKDKIIIRDCSNFAGLNDKYIRVAVKTREDNKRLLSALNMIMEDAIYEGINQRNIAQVHDEIAYTAEV